MINKSESQNLSENWLIANNLIVTKNVDNNTTVFASLRASTLVINNTIIYRHSNAFFASGNSVSQNATFKNNIIVSTNASVQSFTTNCTNCQWDNNLTFSPTTMLTNLPGSNLNNANPEFENVPSHNWSYDYDFNVKPSSAAFGSGTDGRDLGAYGAGYNFSKYGFPFGVPIMDELKVENQLINQGDPLRFSIKARASESRNN